MELESNLMNAYKTAYKLACEQLIAMDMNEVSRNTQSIYAPSTHTLHLEYLNREYLIDCQSGAVTNNNDGEEVTTTVKVLILHYLIHAKATPLVGRLISFKEIPGGGAIYYPNFYKRAILPLIKTFANNPNGLVKAADELDGKKENYGHASITFCIFPQVPVTFVVWQGDDEVPASGTILFDESVTSYLPGEDIVLAASFGVYELISMAKKGGST